MERSMKVPYEGKTVEGVDLDFKQIKEEWNEYQVADGTTIRMKAVVTNIVRLTNQYDKDNNPVYLVKSSNVLTISPPEKLKKGAVAS